MPLDLQDRRDKGGAGENSKETTHIICFQPDVIIRRVLIFKISGIDDCSVKSINQDERSLRVRGGFFGVVRLGALNTTSESILAMARLLVGLSFRVTRASLKFLTQQTTYQLVWLRYPYSRRSG